MSYGNKLGRREINKMLCLCSLWYLLAMHEYLSGHVLIPQAMIWLAMMIFSWCRRGVKF